MGSKGSQTTQASSTQTSSADPRAAAVYADILQRAETASQQGYQPYTGQQVAGFSPDQLAAMQGVSGIQGTYQPMLNQAAQYATAAGQPISASQINAAMSPYIQGVINPTLDIMSTQQAQEMSKLRGTEAQQGAFGGSRSAVAEANLANQQLQAKNQMVAGLMQQGYSQAVAQARADRAAAAQGAGISTGVASAQVATPLQALGAELQTGGLQQQLQQAQLNVPYQQYLQAQAYPYQQLSWLSGIAGGIGPGLGGTSTGQSTSVATPAQPSALSQILGGGLALGLAPFTGGASLAALPGIVARSATGGRINKADGGSVGMGDIDVASTMARALQLADAEMTQPAPMADGGAVGNDGDDIVQGALRMAQAMKRHLGGSASHMADGGVPGATLGTIDVGGKKIVNIFPASSGRGATLHAPNVSYAQSGSIKTPDYGETIKGLGAAFKQPEKSAQTPTKLTPAQMSDGTISGEAGAFSANIPTPTFSPVSFQESFGYASGGLVPHHAQDGGPMFDPTPLEQQVPDNLVSAEEPAPITGETIPLPRARPEPKQSDTFSRMLRQESGGQQFDRSGQPLTSPKGAIGIAQIMPGTAPEAAQLAGLEYDPERLRNDAEYNKALGQAYYNKQLGDFGGNEQLAAAAYNAGPGRVRQALARAQQEGGSYLNYLPTETQKYVANVVGEAPTGQEALAFSGEPQPYSAKIMANAIADLQGQRPEGGPLPYTGEEGRVPAPTPQQAAKADRAASIFERLTGIELSPEGRMALMAMGLKMMATPGSIGTAIGAGGLQGLQTYTDMQRYGQEMALKQQEMALKERQRFVEERKPQKIGERIDRYGIKVDVFGVWDPNKKKWVETDEVGNPMVSGVNKGPAGNIDYTKTGSEFLKTIPVEDRKIAQDIADYKVPPSNPILRGPRAAYYTSLAYGIDPSYSPDEYFNRRREMDYFTGNGLGAKSLQAFNTAVSHMNVLEDISDNLKNRGSQTWNTIANKFQSEFGAPAPNSFDAVKQIVADEIMKSIVPGGGGAGEREELASRIKSSNTPEQMKDVMNQFRNLMGGQLGELERRYTAGTKKQDFQERYLGEDARKVLEKTKEHEKELREKRAAKEAAEPGKAEGAKTHAADIKIDPRDAAAYKGNKEKYRNAINKKYGEGASQKLDKE